jgi:hypothetical protein
MNAVDPELADHANAIAYVTKAVTDLADAQAIIGQLRADLHREEDRVELLREDRDFYRDQANGFRAMLVKLATHQATIGLETIAAQAVVMSIDEAITAKPPATPALEKLEQEFKQGNEVTE